MARLDDLIDAALNRTGDNGAETLIVANHLAQMRTFGIRQGVQFFPVQDDDSKLRENFINKVISGNKLDLTLDRLWDILLCRGRLLLYLRPTGSGNYRINWFPKQQFEAYYSREGDLEEVSIVYTYKVKRALSDGAMGGKKKRWVRLNITANEIQSYESDTELKPDSDFELHQGMEVKQSFPNELGWVPCVVVNNYFLSDENESADDFTWLRHQIERQDDLERSVANNLYFFGNQTLIATRGVSELTEVGIVEQRSTITAKDSFYPVGGRRLNFRRSGTSEDSLAHIKKVVGNVQPEERFGYISPDPVTGDHNLYLKERREAIRTALGGVDELGISSGATAFEVKSLFGRAAATAKKKAKSLYDYGICKILEQAIQAEEELWKKSVEAAIASEGGAEIIAAVYPDAKKQQVKGIVRSVQEGQSLPTEIFQAIADSGYPLPAEGLKPLGDRTVDWRWTGPVYEESSQDLLNKSIVARNMAEDGVGREYCLKQLYPDKTSRELDEMIGSNTSIPFRRIQQTSQAMQQVLGLWGQIGGSPHPQNPQMPMSADPTFSEPLYRAASNILGKLAIDVGRVRQFDPVEINSIPAPNAGSPEMNEPIPEEEHGRSSDRNPYGASPLGGWDGASSAAAYFGSAPSLNPIPGEFAERMAAGVQQPYPSSQYPDLGQLPVPGVLTKHEPNEWGRRGQLPYSQPVSSQQSGVSADPNVRGVPADIAAQPGLLQQLFPTFSDFAEKASRRVSRKRGS